APPQPGSGVDLPGMAAQSGPSCYYLLNSGSGRPVPAAPPGLGESSPPLPPGLAPGASLRCPSGAMECRKLHGQALRGDGTPETSRPDPLLPPKKAGVTA